jgi:hypothetical protein
MAMPSGKLMITSTAFVFASLHNIVDESGLLSANESIRGELLIFQGQGKELGS